MFQPVDYFVNENRFLAIANERHPERPHWLIKAVRAGPQWDVRGIDAFAYVRPEHTPKAIKVPIQVMNKSGGKSSSREAYYGRYPLLLGACLFIRVHRERSDEGIRATVYGELAKIRDSRADFSALLREYIRTPLPEEDMLVRALIKFRKAHLPEANPWLRK